MYFIVMLKPSKCDCRNAYGHRLFLSLSHAACPVPRYPCMMEYDFYEHCVFKLIEAESCLFVLI